MRAIRVGRHNPPPKHAIGVQQWPLRLEGGPPIGMEQTQHACDEGGLCGRRQAQSADEEHGVLRQRSVPQGHAPAAEGDPLRAGMTRRAACADRPSERACCSHGVACALAGRWSQQQPQISSSLLPQQRCTSMSSMRAWGRGVLVGKRGRHIQVQALPSTVEEITKPFEWANTAITYAWILLLLAPRWNFTKTVVLSDFAAILPCLAFLFFFASATSIDSSDPEELGKKVAFLFTEAITDPTKMATLATPAYMAQARLFRVSKGFRAREVERKKEQGHTEQEQALSP
jgi:hypothetical protein